MTNSLRRHLPVLGVLASVAIATAPAAPASASTPSSAGFYIQPAGQADTFQYAGRAGARLRGTVRVVNDSSKARRIRLSSADVGTFPAGGVMYGEAAPRRAGTWIQLDKRVVALAPRATASVGFVTRVPAGAHTGFHYASIVASDTAATPTPRGESKEGRSEVRVRQVVRFALPVRLRLPGRLSTRLTLGRVDTRIDAAGLNLVLDLRNAGNTLVRETAVDLEVTGREGTVLRHRGKLGPFVPDSAIASAIRWDKPPAEGKYRVLGTLRPSGGPPVRIDRTITFSKKEGKSLEKEAGQSPAPSTSTPLLLWLALGGACLLALASLVGYWRMRRRIRSAPVNA